MGTWTDKKIEKLKVLWAKGVSTAEIGKRLDFSKNAIVGKVHRLGLSNRNSPIKTSSPKIEKVKKTATKKVHEEEIKTIKSVKKSSVKTAQISQVKAVDKKKTSKKNESQKLPEPIKQKKIPQQEGVLLIDLASDRCCWPIDDVNSENFHFCGKKVFKNKPYCLEHCAMAYTTSSSSNSRNSAEEKKETE